MLEIPESIVSRESGSGPVIAYDILRLFIGPASLTPRGIDRVDLALARQIFSSESSGNVGILPTPAGVYAFSAARVRSLLNYIQELWAEDTLLADDPQLRSLLAKIAGPRSDAPPASPTRPLSFPQKVSRMLHMLRVTGSFPRRFAGRSVPAAALSADGL